MTKHFSPLVGKPSTGEPDAGEPHVRFGGRGDATQCVVPTPIFGFASSGIVVSPTATQALLHLTKTTGNKFNWLALPTTETRKKTQIGKSAV